MPYGGHRGPPHCTEARPTFTILDCRFEIADLRLQIQLVLVLDIEKRKLREITNHKTQITNKSQ